MRQRNLLTLLIIAFFFISQYETLGRTIKKHNCVHDEIMKDFKPQEVEVTTAESERILQTSTAAPIRITTDYSNLTDTLPNDLTMANYMIKLVEQTKLFYQDMLTVIPITNNIKLSAGAKCLSHTIPSTDQILTTGVANSDIHFFITVTNEPTNSFLAYAGSCYFRAGARKIPLVGRVNFNYYYMQGVNTTDNQEFEDQLETAIHEFTHAFGFSGSQIQNGYWYNKTNSSSYNLSQIFFPNVTFRGFPTHLIATPNILSVAREYFQCSSMQGMQLENQGSSGSLGSHWERTLIQNEIMTAQAISTDSVFTNFTIALLKDTGYYESVRELPFDKITWGKGRGCSFVNNACNDTTQTFPEFCTDAQVASQSVNCNYEQTGAGYCYGTNEFGDKCPFIATYNNRYCLNASQTAFKTYTKYGLNSHCFISNLLPSGYSGGSKYDCFEAYCLEGGSKINITVGTLNYVCTTPGQVLTALQGHSGNITCPSDFSVFCDSQVSCQNFCSSNGYCMGLECYCNQQYAGLDCSTQCANFLHNGQCVNSCPISFYPKNNTRVCLSCHSSCYQCYAELNSTCLSCQTGYYFSNNACGVNCPALSYKDSTTKSCVTTCPNSQFKDPTTMSCVSTCPSTYIGNSTTGECQISCTSSQFYDSSTNSCLSQCPTGLFGDTISRNCVQQCPSSYQGNSVSRLCEQVCQTGQYKQQSTNTCVSICPTGYFGNSVTQTCVTSCPTGTFGDALDNRICTATCSGSQAGDTSSKQCVQICPSTLSFNNTVTKQCVSKCNAPQYIYGQLCVAVCQTGLYTDIIALTCLATCPSTTVTNSNQMKCLPNCNTGQYYDTVAKTCVAQCPTGYYGDSTSITCVTTCPSGYQANSNTQLCTLLSCQSSQYKDFIANACVSKCTSGSYGDQSTLTCVSKCPANYFGDSISGLCVQNCPTGKFKDYINQVCVATCPASTLADSLALNCTTSCSQSQFADYDLKTCVASCNSTQFTDVNSKSCVTTCPTTTFQEVKLCVKVCSAGSYGDPTQSKCVTQCPANYYGDPTTKLCVLTCPSTLFSDRINFLCVNNCPSPSYVYNKACYSTCPSPLFGDISTNTCVQSCPSTTITNQAIMLCVLPCSGSQFYDFTTSKCVDTCPTSLFSDLVTKTCVQTCSSSLFKDSSTQQCLTQCSATQFINNITKECLSQCPASYFTNLANRFCVTSCPTPLFSNLRNRTCNVDCPTDLFTNNASKVCDTKCASPLSIDLASKSCVSTCPSGTKQLGVFCVLACPVATVFDFSTNACKECKSFVSGCAACNISNFVSPQNYSVICTTCTQGFYRPVQNNTCLSCNETINGCLNCRYNAQLTPTSVECLDCGLRNGFNSTSQTCKPCDTFFSGCVACSNVNISTTQRQMQCLDCGYMLFLNTNTSKCEKCEQFIPGCLGCTSTSTNVGTTTTVSATCYDCGYGRYYNPAGKNCSFCNATIKDCANCQPQLVPGTNTNVLVCLNCASTYKQYNAQKQACELCTVQQNCQQCSFDSQGVSICTQCSSGYYFNSTAKQCLQCSGKVSGCQTCTEITGSSNINCQSCQYSTYLDTISKTCKSCSTFKSQCQQCSYINQVLQCTDCGYGQFYNLTSQSCVSCSNITPGCTMCTQATSTASATCAECDYGKFYNSLTSTCALCNTTISGCLACKQQNVQGSTTQKELVCTYCEYKMAFKYSTKQCVSCDDLIPDCEQCTVDLSTNQVSCQYCKYGQLMQDNKCLNCNDQIPGCRGCYLQQTPFQTQEFYCSDCRGISTSSSGTVEGTYFSLSSKSCKKCSERVTGCIGCGENYIWGSTTVGTTAASTKIEFNCWNCGEGNFFNNYTAACDNCASICQNCKSCYYDHWNKKKPVCQECVQGMYYDQNFEQCVSCATGYPGCQTCYGYLDYSTQNIMVDCQQCLPGYAIDYQNKRCVKTINCQDNCDRCSVVNTTIENYNVTVTIVDPTNTSKFITKNETRQRTVVITKCQVCVEGYVLNQDQSKCIFDQECNQGRYFDGLTCQYCYNAVPGCYNCNRKLGANVTCTSCFNNFNLLPDTGVCEVSTGKLNCPPGCSNCMYNTTSAEVWCTTCQPSFKLNITTKRCQLDCVSLGLNNCENCMKVMDTALNTSSIQCNKCWNGFVLSQDRKCNLAQKCGENQTFYGNNGSCVQCPENCLGCKDVSQIGESLKLRCDFCAQGYSPNQEFSQCLQAGDQTVQQYCPIHCTACQFKSSAYSLNCTSCELPFVLISAGSGKQGTTANYGSELDIYKCGVICNYPCNSCDFNFRLSQYYCKQCYSGYLLNSYGQCIQSRQCTTGDYFDPNQFQTETYASTFTCTKCPAFCSSCVYSDLLSSSICSFCNNGYKLNLAGNCILKTNVTESSCPIGKYQNIAASACVDCPINCAFCQFDNALAKAICQTCMKGYVPSKTEGCMLNSTCNAGQYSKPSSTGLQCLDCSSNCLECFFDTAILVDKCSKCQENYYLNSKGVCVSTVCKDGYIFSQELGCELCPAFCYKCSRPTSTSKPICLTGQCFPSYKLNQTSGQCIFDPMYCQSNNQVAVGNECKDCPYNCTSCQLLTGYATPQIKCLSCSTLFNLTNGRCQYNQCSASQYYGLSFTNWKLGCYNCPAGCSQCYFDQYIQKILCTSCQANYDFSTTDSWCNLKQTAAKPTCLSNQTLVEDKVQGQYCAACPASCSQCTFNQKMICLSCIKDFNLTNYRCVPNYAVIQASTCSAVAGTAAQAYNYITLQCQNCPQGCSECKQSFAEEQPVFACMKCLAGFTWYTDWKCYKSCPSGQLAYFDNGQQNCRACQSNCLNCDLDYIPSPPQELCYKCADGFYQSKGQCIANPQCYTDQYLTITVNNTQHLTFNAECRQCPKGCNSCKPQVASSSNTADQTGKIECIDCNAGFVKNDNGFCVISTYNTKDSIDCGASDSGYYKYFESALSKWVCGTCSTGCSSCISVQKCTACQTNFYLSTSTDQCVAIPQCNTQQYYSAFSKKCLQCPSGCSQCKLADSNKEDTILCTVCSTPFSLSSTGNCVKSLSDTDKLITNSEFCSADTRTYAVLIDGAVQCQQCPNSCLTCNLENPKLVTSILKCSTCALGFQVLNDQCVSRCSIGEYLLGTICQPCHFSCKECSDGSDKCLSCGDLYEFTATSAGSCLEKQKSSSDSTSSSTTTNTKDCGLEAYYDLIADACVCNQADLYFNSQTNNCSSYSDYVKVCSIGQFLDSKTNQCLPCYSSDDKGRCAICQGSTATDCLECVAGYFLDKSSYSCNQCTSGCQLCDSSLICTKCEAGYYRYTELINGQTTVQCYSICPKGTLPYLISLYYLNEELFSAEEKQKYMSSSQVFTSVSNKPAIAVNINYEPIFDNLPWQFDSITGMPTYLNQKIRLECVPCKDHCTDCISTRLIIPDQNNQCYEGDYCPGDYVIQLIDGKKQCKIPPADAFVTSFIDRPTLALESGIQPLNKNLFIELNTTADNLRFGPITYQWSVIDIKQDVAGLKKANPKQNYSETFSNSQKQQIKTQFLQQVALNKKYLQVNQKNLKQFVVYIIQVEAKLQYTSQTQRVDMIKELLNITVRNIPTFRSVQDLGVNEDLITVSPQSGVSGLTKYQAKYSICNSPAYVKPALTSGNWKFVIEVIQNKNNVTSFTLSSSQCSDYLDFTIPGNKLSDSVYNVQFTFSFGENYYQAARKIKALANPQYNLKTDSTIVKLSSNSTSTVISQSDLAIGASLIQNEVALGKQTCPAADLIMNSSLYQIQGPCNTSQSTATACCGHGTCVLSQSSSQYQCKCMTGYQGIFCNIPQAVTDNIKDLITKLVDQLKAQKIDLKNVDSIIQTINKLVKTQTIDTAIIKILLDQLNAASKYVKDVKTLNLLLDTISEIQKGFSIDGITSTSIQTNSLQNTTLSAINQAVLTTSSQLSVANPESSFNGGGFTGKSTLVNQKDIVSDKIQVQLPNTNKTGSLSIGIDKAVLGLLQSVALSTLVSSNTLMNAAVGGKQLVSDNLEISLINPTSGTKLVVKNLTGTCPIKFQMNAVTKNTQKVNNTFQCVYYDPDTNKYSSNGCNATNITKVSQDSFTVTCCCNHLSLVSVSENEYQLPSVVPTNITEQLDQAQNGLIHQACLFIFTILLALVLNI